jgi:DNA (cytosine-5)-methyltransferase 1
MTKFKEWNFESDVDLLVGGTPCQSFSVAGLRKGLDDPRGNLMLTYLAIADKYRPRWLVWENVPGVLSSNGGKDFGVFLGALGELGYGFAYRILDAQYFGVAQRRRRVFVVGYLGDWRAAAAVLFERHSLQGHPAPSREARKSVAASTRTGAANSNWPAQISSTLDTTFGTKQGLEDQHVNAGCPMFVPAYGIPGNWIGRKPENGGNATEPMHDVAPCLTKTDQHGVAQPICLMDQGGSVMNIEHNMTGTLRRETHGHEPIVMQAVAVGTDLYNGAITGDVAATMSTHGGDGNGTGPTVMQAMAVRRLTPVECERLQGFPDSYTDIKSKVKPTPDGPRYKALGNSMAVPVMAWIGQRIQEVEAICKQNK